MSSIILTTDQQAALDAFIKFLTNPMEPVFVLSGYSGTGKSTLVKEIVNRYSQLMQSAKLIDPSIKILNVVLTATTNKAAESLTHVTGEPVSTIHSFLGLAVKTDFETGKTQLVCRTKEIKYDSLIFIDEASYVDRQLLELIFKLTKHCKIVFMGDPAQLTPVMSSNTPVFDAGFPGAHLSQVVRQAEGNPIIELSTLFRETVNTGEFFSFKPDGQAIKHLPRDAFNQAIIDEFNQPNWHYKDSKVLGWTNKCAVNFNHAIQDVVKGTPEFVVGDYAVCNKYVSSNRISFKTDQLVCITSISEPVVESGVSGRYYGLDGKVSFFCPNSLKEKNDRIKIARAKEDFDLIERADTQWIDLRAAYACTINKAQGSTFDRVFIDLDDIRRCNSGDQIARMMYVGVSRARHQVILTGDLA